MDLSYFFDATQVPSATIYAFLLNLVGIPLFFIVAGWLITRMK
ncbi:MULTISPECIES: hypothetical protein [Laceyella]|jgi:hypothetical protein|uniref:Uncharacterized protein n=3 Tax=Laceyella TaxID=292635 RepID=A0AA45WP31_9BACL|nr:MULTISPECIES: hypothetical protein [Laceyella]PRZ14298.1 hypothetical protein CLV36_10658 [Laceyella sediminis]TCW41445.1 hypothetical protein EDC32_1011111 [Laceyella sacchari]UWE05011.1 hypothetical protein NYR52_07810 [Laceyella sacchari]SMP19905.1 hypothetical protein SAMN06265361_103319 [Laceyella tengchongensis]